MGDWQMQLVRVEREPATLLQALVEESIRKPRSNDKLAELL